MDVMASGVPAAGNAYGYTPDVAVATFLGSGNVGIGTTTPDTGFATSIPNARLSILNPSGGANIKARLSIGGGASHYTAIEGEHTTGGATILYFMTCMDAATNSGNPQTRMTITSNGTIFFNAYTANGTLSVINGTGQVNASSDRRIKENIVYQSDTQQGLASVLNLKPATYNMIGSSGTYLGFIAQDVEQDIPLAVDGKKYEWQWEITEDNKPKFDANGDIVYKLDADGNKIVRPRGVSDRAIIATQTLAIQELAKQATSQAALVQELSKKLDAKSAALDALIAWAQTMGYPASS
jgi:hypothetical protein